MIQVQKDRLCQCCMVYDYRIKRWTFIEKDWCWGKRVQWLFFRRFSAIFPATFFLWFWWYSSPVHKKALTYMYIHLIFFFVKFTKKKCFCFFIIFIYYFNFNFFNFSLAIVAMLLLYFCFGVMVGASSSRPWVTLILPPCKHNKRIEKIYYSCVLYRLLYLHFVFPFRPWEFFLVESWASSIFMDKSSWQFTAWWRKYRKKTPSV